MSSPSRRFAFLLGVSLVAATVSVPRAAADEAPPVCMGSAATVWGSGALEGTEGDDVIVGGGGPDVINGYEGNDIICGLGGGDTIDAGPGNDRIRGGKHVDVIDGGEGRDIIRGGKGDDTIIGGGGRDRLIGNGGDDLLVGGSELDAIFGGSGSDLMLGNDGADLLRGGAEDDDLQGGAGSDSLWGGDGDDSLFGDEGDDLLYGRGQNDLLYGGSGIDLLYGGSGADELWGGECVEIGWRGDNHFCRAVPSGRVANGTAGEEGDLLYGGASFDACNCGEGVDCSQAGCETYRGWRGDWWDKSTAEEWRPYIEAAFTAYGLEDEIEHAMQIAACESLGDPFQVTPPTVPPAYSDLAVAGLFQHRLLYWEGRSTAAGMAGLPPYRPDVNAEVAAWLVDFSIYWLDEPWYHWGANPDYGGCYDLLVDGGYWEEPPEG